MFDGAFVLAASAADLQRLRVAALLTSLALLAGCSPGTRAPVIDLSAAPSPVSPPSEPQTSAHASYVVKPGDTLYSIARATGTNVDSLVRWNNITDPAQLRIGQVLKLGRSSSAPGGGLAPSTQEPTQPTVTAPVSPPPVRSEPALRADDANVIQWAWPASGEIIQTFSTTTKGIDIVGTPGDPVQAAADGKVMYSGNGVRGLGNLLIINHQSGFITAYAHNRTLLVKAGQEVKRGAKIAEIGQTDTTSPRLHFEVRRQGTPVNPLQYLPQR